MSTPLKSIRTQLGIRQKDLARHCDATQPHISSIENGDDRASPDLAERIAKFIKGKVEELPASDRRRQLEFSELHVLYPGRFRPHVSNEDDGVTV